MTKETMDDAQPNDPLARRRSAQKVLTLLAIVLVLAGLAFALNRLAIEGPPPTTLTPYDSMRLWTRASEPLQRTTASDVLTELERRSLLGPQTRARLHAPGGREQLENELFAEIHQAANPDVTAYVSPGDSIMEAAQQAVERLKWNE